MKQINLNIHNILRIKILNPSKSIFKELNSPFSYFAVTGEIKPDIEVILGDFREDLSRCVAIDHKYFVRENYIFFKETIGLLSWKVELAGLDSDKCKVRISYGKFNKLVFPIALYLDQIMYNYLLYPLLERYFLIKRCLLLHAGSAADNGKGIMFAGRGGSYKTTLIMNLVRRHFFSMGDGWSIVKDNEIYSFPTCLSFFEYRQKNLPEENLSLGHKLNILRFLFKTSSHKNLIKDRARFDSLFIIHKENRQDVKVENVYDKDALSEMLLANNRLEWKANLPYKHDISKFFDAYEYVYPPKNKGLKYENMFRTTLLDYLESVRAYKMRIPLKWQIENLDALKKYIGI